MKVYPQYGSPGAGIAFMIMVVIALAITFPTAAVIVGILLLIWAVIVIVHTVRHPQQ